MAQQPNPDLVKADICRLLSACYYQPTEDFLEENVFAQLAELLSVFSGNYASLAKEMDSSFRNIGAESLLLDYSQLFLGPFEIPAKPYGSVYLDGERVVMGDSTMQVLDLYREGGFEVAADFSEMPDHIAVELEFLYLLSFQLGQLKDSEKNDQKHLKSVKSVFLNEYLGRWVGSLAEAMRKGAQTEFYKSLADVTEQFILKEMQDKETVSTQ